MKELKIDLELLMQSCSFNEDDLGKEYLDTEKGDILNIPNEVREVVDGNKKEQELDDWQTELLEEAYAVKENREDRYIIIPAIEESYFCDAMMLFVQEKVTSEEMRENLLQALKSNEPMRNFKSTIFKYEAEIDKWQDYEEDKCKKYVIDWLKSIDIKAV